MRDDAEVVLGVNKKGKFSMESPFFDVFLGLSGSVLEVADDSLFRCFFGVGLST